MKNGIKLTLGSIIFLLLFLLPTSIASASKGSRIEGDIIRGTHSIVSKVNSNKVVDANLNSNNVTIWNNTSGNNQKWTFIYDYNKHAYKIKNKATNKVLAWDSSRGNNVIEYKDLGDVKDQYWFISEPSHEGYHVIKSYYNPNMVLDLSGSNTSNGSNIIVHKITNNANQKWKLIEQPADNFSILDNRFGIETTNIGLDTGITNLKFNKINDRYKLVRDTKFPNDLMTVKYPFTINIYSTYNGLVSGLEFSKTIPSGINMSTLDNLLDEIPALKMEDGIQIIAAPTNLMGTPKVYITGGIINDYDIFDHSKGMTNYESSRRTFILTPNGLKLDPMIM